MEKVTAVLICGPADQTPIALPAYSAIHEVRDNGTVHQYVRTTAHRPVVGRRPMAVP
jgi:hypothetical protein